MPSIIVEFGKTVNRDIDISDIDYIEITVDQGEVTVQLIEVSNSTIKASLQNISAGQPQHLNIANLEKNNAKYQIKFIASQRNNSKEATLSFQGRKNRMNCMNIPLA
ncbi:MAG: hypothetical protein V7L31_08715 [Nostoc sp.]|uniref:hypothetical protein n=1 Tax=Nostoc sp. TaxID=1180 RepID=UPI002FF0A745